MHIYIYKAIISEFF